VVVSKTTRLRALRLAKEADASGKPEKPKPDTKAHTELVANLDTRPAKPKRATKKPKMKAGPRRTP
jgi:hypothetical protein